MSAPPPPLYTDVDRLAWVRPATGLAAGGYTLVAVVTNVVAPGHLVSRWQSVVAAVLCTAAFALARRAPRPAAAITLLVVLAELLLALFEAGDLLATSILVFPTLVTAVALIWGEAALLGAAGAALILVPLTPWAGRMVKGLGGYDPEQLRSLLIIEIIFVAFAMFVRAIIRAYRELHGETQRAWLRYLDIFRETPDGLVELDAAGHVTEANPSAVALLRMRAVTGGVPWAEVLAGAGLVVRPELAAANARGPVLAALADDEAGGGLEFTFRPSTGAAGRTLVVVRDVTQRRQAELRRAEELRMESVGRLAGGVAHDFNNLLTAIGGHAELLRDHPDLRVRQHVGDIVQAQRRAASLTRQLLSFARLDLCQPESLNLNDLLAHCTPLLERLVGEPSQLHVVPGEQVTVEADRGQLEQVLVNLVSNARDASSADAFVEVRTRALERSEAGRLGSTLTAERQVLLEVVDWGRGIAPEVRTRLFEPFFTTKGVGQGHGMGLATAHGLVAQNRGAIALDSAPGRGTTARVFLPWAPPAGAGPVTAPARTRGHVMLVDDDLVSLAPLVQVLERLGYRATVVKDGFQALRTLRAESAPLAALVCDLRLPGMSGLELADRVRERQPDLPVLFLSETRVPAIPGRSLDPVRDVMVKPVTAVEFAARLRSVLPPT